MLIPKEPSQRDRFYLFSYKLPRCNMEKDDGIFLDVIEEMGRLYVTVRLGEKTTARDYRKAESIAIALRDRLNEFQGRKAVEQNQLLNEIQLHIDLGETHAEIAKKVNARITELLRAYLKLPHQDTFRGRALLLEVREILTELNAGQEDIRQRSEPGRNNKDEKERIQEWIDALIKEALKQIGKNKEPFGNNFPVSSYHVKHTIRQWQMKKRRAKT